MIGRITADARIVPISMSAGLIAPEPWSPWLDRDARTTPRGTADRARPVNSLWRVEVSPNFPRLRHSGEGRNPAKTLAYLLDTGLAGMTGQVTLTCRAALMVSASAAASVTGNEHCGPMQT